MKLSNKVYDKLKWTVMTVMPALAVLLTTVGHLLGWVHTELAVNLLNAVTVFACAVLGLSNYSYQSGGKPDESH